VTVTRGPVWKSILVATGIAFAVAGLGRLATDLGPWYFNLRQPPWKPPDWAFGPAWTIIFGFIACSGGLAWHAARNRGERVRVALLFGANAALNVLWSALFFALRRPDWALVEVVLLWLSILAMIAGVTRISRPAGGLLVPYLVWVSFAATLNLAVVRLNEPFG